MTRRSQPMPFSLESERAYLGAILLRGVDVVEPAGPMHHDYFYDPRHREVFAAMARCAYDRKPIDPVTVFDTAGERARSFGGLTFLSELLGSVFTADNIGWYAERIRRTWMLRKFIIAASELADSPIETMDQPAVIIDNARAKFEAMGEEWRQLCSDKK